MGKSEVELVGGGVDTPARSARTGGAAQPPLDLTIRHISTEYRGDGASRDMTTEADSAKLDGCSSGPPAAAEQNGEHQ